MKRIGFAVMVDDLCAIDGQRPYRILAQPLRGTRVEEFCILVAFADNSEFPALFPMSCMLLDREGKGLLSRPSQCKLSCRQVSVFLKQINHKMIVVIMGGNETVGFFPNLGGEAKMLHLGGEDSCCIVCGHGTVPVGDGCGEKIGIKQPRVFKTEKRS
jgi:hypothetical protein